MKNRFLFLAVGLAVIIFGFYYARYQPTLKKNGQLTASTVHYDLNVKTEYGQPIKVARVIDGDTIVLINGERVRYIGIDTPEEFDARKPVQCFAKEAAGKNKELVEGKTITLYKDMDDKDKYGRWLGFVYLENGTFVNLELVKQGYAFAYSYPPDVSKADQFRAAETYARNNKLGLWNGRCSVSSPRNGREQTNPAQ